MMNTTFSSSSSTIFPNNAAGNMHNILHLMMSEMHTVELLASILVFISIHSLRQKSRHGLPCWPLLGMLPSLLLALQGNVYEWITHILLSRQNNGTFVFRGPTFSNLHCMVTADPRNLEHLLKTRFYNFPKGGYFRSTLRDFLGDGIFNADGGEWRAQRKIASLEFHSAKFRQMTTNSLVDLIHLRLLPILQEKSESESESKASIIDLQDILLRLTFDNVCMIAFGVDPGCLRPGLPQIPFARAFEAATEAAILRFVMPTLLWRGMRRLGVVSEGRLKESVRAVDDFAHQVIRARRKELELETTTGNPKSKNNLLTLFMGLRDEDGQPFSDSFLRDVCVNFILAGRDTSSVALTWFFLLLNGSPEVEGKILAEICGIVRERGDQATLAPDFVFRPEEVKRMDYLHAALSEALRLYPSVPLDHKEVLEDDEFPDGTKLKKGTKVVYSIYSMGRMENIWGKDCREFKPDRWLRNGRFMSESAYKFAAFNGGPRLCLGKDFAYYQMKFVAASILFRYRIVVVEGLTVEPKMALTMYMKYGLKVYVRRRDPMEIESYNFKLPH
ncbi:Cytochrome P450 86B1 [Striga hermonthica]|uniref:Cytochrome P450 86B1 n=1 Tax=Striga hermonthica TaxID=68872 RepID=A0A9N7N8X7_STRHE|nr:Cytochrome P450 86B1 [Striga hermonthica]